MSFRNLRALGLVGLLSGLFTLLSCGVDDSDHVFLSVKADTAWIQYDSVTVTLKDLKGDVIRVLFADKMNSVTDLQKLPADEYAGGKVLIEVQVYEDDKVVFQEIRQYDGSTQSTSKRDTTIDFISDKSPIDSNGLTIQPDQLVLYAHGESDTLQPTPVAAWSGKSLTWSSSAPEVASVSIGGVVSGLTEGMAWIYCESGTLRDSSRVQVIVDVPVVDVGQPDTAALVGSSLLFSIQATQKYGTIAMFKWDLDGDGTWDDSATGYPKSQTVFTTSAPKVFATEGLVVLRFYVRDGEGNAVTVPKKLTIADQFPIIDTVSLDTVISIGDTAMLSGRTHVTKGSLASFSWDFNSDGTLDDSGSLTGMTAQIATKHMFPSAGFYKSLLRVTDDKGITVSRPISVTVKQDAPWVFAGLDTAVSVGAQIQLHGQARDTLGQIASRFWIIAGTVPYSTLTGEYSFAAPMAPTQLMCVYQVTDDDGNTKNDTVFVSVGGSQTASIDSIAATPKLISIRDTVRYTAKVHASAGMTPKAYWDFDGNATPDDSIRFSGDTTLTSWFAFPTPGTFKTTLKISNGSGTLATQQATIDVRVAKPTANAGTDTSVKVGGVVQLHGKGVDSLSGTVVKLEWKIGTGNYSVVSKADTSFTAPATPGDVTCIFRITDDDGNVDSDQVVISVADVQAPKIDSIKVGRDTISIKDSIQIVGAFTATTGTLKQYTIDYEGDGTADDSGALTGVTQKITKGHVYPLAGTFTPTFKVYNDAGLVETGKASVRVKVDAPFVDAGPDTTVAIGTPVNLHGTARDTMGTLAKREWKIGTGFYTATQKLDTSIVAPATAQALKCYFRVTDDDGNVAVDSVLVTVFVPASTNANLASATFLPTLTLNQAFDSTKTAYSASVAYTFSSTVLTATAAQGAATVRTTLNTNAVTGGNLALIVGVNTVVVTVTSQAGNTKAYTFTITRAAAAADANLATLSFTPTIALSSTFSPATITYTATIANSVATATVAAAASSGSATVAIKLNTVTVTGTTLNFIVGTNTLAITVTAQDGTTKTYTVTITRANNNVATLSTLILAAGHTFNVAFSPNTFTYNITALATATVCTFTPTATDPNATITVDGADVPTGTKSGNLSFPIGTTAHTIDVRAADGVTTQTYTVNVWRNAATPLSVAYANLSGASPGGTATNAYTPNSGTVTYTYSSQGVYTVKFTGLGTYSNATGIGHVTASGTTGGYCKITSWTANADITAGVTCMDTQGRVLDLPFSVLVLLPRGNGSGGNAYAWADQFTATGAYTPDLSRSWNSATGFSPISIAHPSTGNYDVTFKGQGSGTDLGNIMVTGYGSGNNRCAVSSWSAVSGDLVARVGCTNTSGNAVNTQFNISMLKGYTGTDFAVATARVTGDSPDTRGPYSTNNAGDAIIASANANAGAFNMTFGSIITLGQGRPRILMLTPFGTATSSCQVESAATYGSNNIYATTNCFDTAGDPVNVGMDIWIIN